MTPDFRHGLVQTHDGREARRASLLTRGVAIAVDLILAVATASLLFYLLSLYAPLDTPRSRVPVGVVVALAFAYLVVGRDHVLSPGRWLFGLELARLPGNVPGLMGRRISVYADDASPARDPLPRAILAIVLATLLSGLCLTASLTTTLAFSTAVVHLEEGRGIDGARGPFERAPLPRTLLVGQRHALVQIDARDAADAAVTLEFLLERAGGGWQVEAARRATRPQLARFSLGALDTEILGIADRSP